MTVVLLEVRSPGTMVPWTWREGIDWVVRSTACPCLAPAPQRRAILWRTSVSNSDLPVAWGESCAYKSSYMKLCVDVTTHLIYDEWAHHKRDRQKDSLTHTDTQKISSEQCLIISTGEVTWFKLRIIVQCCSLFIMLFICITGAVSEPPGSPQYSHLSFSAV